MNRDNFALVACLLVIVVIYVTSHPNVDEQSKLAILRSIAANHRPRVICFYSDGYVCDSVRSQLKNALAVYGNSIDFQSVNVKDEGNKQLLQDFQVAAVQRSCGGFMPTTYIFNGKGQEVFMISGFIDQSSLYYILRRIYMETIDKASESELNKVGKKKAHHSNR